MDYQGVIRGMISSTAVFALFFFANVSSQAADGPGFDLPLTCQTSAPCHVQNLMDMESGPGHRDPFCSAATYNGHKGTDIRRRNLADMRSNDTIFAMADGIIKARRNNARDQLMENKSDIASVKGKECGNGLVIDHGPVDGAIYRVQLCHLAQNSVKVQIGDRVKRGEAIARMGLSGATEFPHIHFSIRKNGKLIDPFSGRGQNTACRKNGTSETLFSKSALKIMIESGFRALLEDGFANAPVDGRTLLRGQSQKPDKNSPLVYYAKFVNLKKADRLQLTITGPDGLFARSKTNPLPRNKATYTVYTGRKGPPKPGTYQGIAELIRNGNTIEVHRSTPFQIR